MLRQLIYVSQAVRLQSDEELLELLKASRERNLKAHITGFLVYRQGVFLQALEGEEKVLAAVWEKIQADRRHENIILIRDAPIGERDFDEWSMGFLNIAHLDLSRIPGYCAFLENDFSPEALHAKPGMALDFLLDLKYCDLP